MRIPLSLVITTILFFGLISTSEVSAQNTLADKVVGKYKGKLKNQSSDLDSYKIKITKVSDEKVKIQPVSGSSSQTFEVKLSQQVMGKITMIRFKLPGDNLMNNGMYVDANGRISYSLHLGGDNPRNIEVFSGKKL